MEERAESTRYLEEKPFFIFLLELHQATPRRDRTSRRSISSEQWKEEIS
jgi:hypothetical protein